MSREEGRRCCERYDALMERMPDYEAAVEALERLVADAAGMDDGVDEYFTQAIEQASAALARLRDEVTA